MAGAIVPIIGALAPSIINLIAGLVHQKAPVQQAALGSGTGAVKFANLFLDVMNDLTKAHAAGQIDTIPDDATAKTVIQSVISSMKLLGLLDSSALPDAPTIAPVAVAAKPAATTKAAPGSQSFALANGQVLTFSVV
jgi:hypothetical protein